MQRVKHLWAAFKNFAILFSFIINLVLIITLLIVVGLLYQIKTGIAEPLIDGLHASFVGLDKATIDRIIPVRDEIPIAFTLPLEQNTTVVLTAPVPLQAQATFNLPGGGGTINGIVSISLPVGLSLPVALDLDVPVETTVPVSLDVRAVIPLEETQLHDPFENLRGLLDPFVRVLDNLPSNPDEGQVFLDTLVAGIRGEGPMPNLLEPTDGSQYPWPGYSVTAGDGYVWPADTPPQPGEMTGTVPEGLAPWDAAPDAPDGIYIPYGQVGPAGIIPAGNELIDPEAVLPMGGATGQGADTAVPTATPSTGDLGILPAETGTASEEAAPTVVETGSPPAGDLGIITPTSVP